jgi:hypothetical protein
MNALAYNTTVHPKTKSLNYKFLLTISLILAALGWGDCCPIATLLRSSLWKSTIFSCSALVTPLSGLLPHLGCGDYIGKKLWMLNIMKSNLLNLKSNG